jgi:hypothetical protein
LNAPMTARQVRLAPNVQSASSAAMVA